MERLIEDLAITINERTLDATYPPISVALKWTAHGWEIEGAWLDKDARIDDHADFQSWLPDIYKWIDGDCKLNSGDLDLRAYA